MEVYLVFFTTKGMKFTEFLIKFNNFFLRVLRDLRGFISVSYRGKGYFGLEF
jgi:ribosomal protein L5